MATPVRTILIAPLDWGLGHTTRCIPVIRHLLINGHRVLFAGSPRQQAFIAVQCPQAALYNLEGYGVKYGKRWLMLHLIFQMRRLLQIVRREHRWLRELAQREELDGIISDNRYGLWHPQIPCVIMTHQLQVWSGLGALADRLLRRLHDRFLERFNACWVVDAAGAENLAGRLSHPAKLSANTRFIGWLSQLAGIKEAALSRRYKCLVLLSGPEPQRTMLADVLWQQMLQTKYSVAFVEGAPGLRRDDVPRHIQHLPEADAGQIAALMQASELIICRSGYSTIMDVVCLQKRTAVIPTPGQTEQEYLAQSLSRRGIVSLWPRHLSADDAIEAALNSPFAMPGAEGTFTQFIPVLESWLSKL